ncbi:MAG TPA: universal stress protein [Candidatus Polarisedimenticolaceae bacterium]|nr:universal stress protein [Candidatus Polarisedimenticolaceae bacterium]
MYKTIYVPVDNSDFSNRAAERAVLLGKTFASRLVGCHVYAAKMHDYRFKQMEYTLPDEYLEETELERQRKIHDSLITMGLRLISDCYLEPLQRTCQEQGLEFEPKMMDGKHHVEIVRDVQASDYDLTVLGVMGLGRVRDSQIGSVCERVVRASRRDVWVVKHLPEAGEAEGDTILVGIDGSPQSFGALATAIELAARFGKQVEVIAVYDPYLHYSVFNSVVNVLTEKAAKVFRFEEQNQLHEEIIDTGLAQIYQSHLDVAARTARERGVEVKQTLLDGKAFQKVLDHVRKTKPWLLVIGRLGVHSAKDEPGLGSNAENLLRACPCDVLFTTRLELPELDVRAEESIRWTPESLERMKRVPDQVRGIARTAILRLAIEKGHSVITSDLLDEAMERFMPKGAAQRTAWLAESLALEQAKKQGVALCKKCGLAAADPNPVKCAVCGGTNFEAVTPEMLERIAAAEGGLDEETTYDGRKLQWTQDAKRALWTLKDAYQRRRAKARVEKSARVKKLPTVTLDFARRVIEEETGLPLVVPPAGELPLPEAGVVPAAAAVEDGLKLVARDAKNNPLLSVFDWTPEAIERVLRVPAGFMRKKTQDRIEELARERQAAAIDLTLVEDGIAFGRKMMEEMITGYQAAGGGNGTKGETYLNEVGVMSAMAAKRKELNEPEA